MTPTANLLDPSSAAYKKARRQFYKATRGRSDIGQNWTPFRTSEKHFKARFPPPDLSNVLDLAQLDPSREEELLQGVWLGSTSPFEYKKLSGSVYTVPAVPGLVILPSFLDSAEQRKLVRWSLEKQARAPNPTNLDIHYHLPKDGLWNSCVAGDDITILPKAGGSDVVEATSPGPRQLINNTPVSIENYEIIAKTPKPPSAPSACAQPTSPASLLRKLRWANIGWYYHWGTKQYDLSKGKGEIDDHLRSICKNAVATVNWNDVYDGTEDVAWNQSEWKSWGETYEPDAGIVNFYQTKDTLMAHVDRSEVCATSPLVSISLGNAGIFLIGGNTRDTEPVPVLLRSGDVVIMSGSCRRAYHGVPRILEGTLPGHMKGEAEADWISFSDFLEATRININVRQVFPKGSRDAEA